MYQVTRNATPFVSHCQLLFFQPPCPVKKMLRDPSRIRYKRLLPRFWQQSTYPQTLASIPNRLEPQQQRAFPSGNRNDGHTHRPSVSSEPPRGLVATALTHTRRGGSPLCIIDCAYQFLVNLRDDTSVGTLAERSRGHVPPRTKPGARHTLSDPSRTTQAEGVNYVSRKGGIQPSANELLTVAFVVPCGSATPLLARLCGHWKPTVSLPALLMSRVILFPTPGSREFPTTVGLSVFFPPFKKRWWRELWVCGQLGAKRRVVHISTALLYPLQADILCLASPQISLPSAGLHSACSRWRKEV